MMSKSVTIKLDEKLIRWARHQAVDAGTSLTGWIAGLIKEKFILMTNQEKNAIESIQMIERAKSCGGQRFTREELHET